eukprot:TRINITY_DN6762_c0_g1_i1.p1 TRINITY_DN6762_c0_g1~~TRINITY_DN6762_c0_g1_i1.p1  ORF type:complete len:928 (-),score=157.14 TRINITY_DN6762_c0_g1_i1:189-2888(-)
MVVSPCEQIDLQFGVGAPGDFSSTLSSWLLDHERRLQAFLGTWMDHQAEVSGKLIVQLGHVARLLEDTHAERVAKVKLDLSRVSADTVAPSVMIGAERCGASQPTWDGAGACKTPAVIQGLEAEEFDTSAQQKVDTEHDNEAPLVKGAELIPVGKITGGTKLANMRSVLQVKGDRGSGSDEDDRESEADVDVEAKQCDDDTPTSNEAQTKAALEEVKTKEHERQVDDSRTMLALTISSGSNGAALGICDAVKPEAQRAVPHACRSTNEWPLPLDEAIDVDSFLESEACRNSVAAAARGRVSSGCQTDGFGFAFGVLQPNFGDCMEEASSTPPRQGTPETPWERTDAFALNARCARLGEDTSSHNKCPNKVATSRAKTVYKDRHDVPEPLRSSEHNPFCTPRQYDEATVETADLIPLAVRLEQVVAFCKESKTRLDQKSRKSRRTTRYSITQPSTPAADIKRYVDPKRSELTHDTSTASLESTPSSRDRKGRPEGKGNRKAREWLETAIDKEGRSLVEAVVCSNRFDFCCGGVILINAGLIGISTQWRVNHDEEPVFMGLAERLCSVFFFCELCLRAYVSGRSYFVNRDRYWNVFDILLVCLSVVDLLGAETSGYVTLKALKMLRIVRIFRVFRFFQEMAIFGTMIGGALRTLVWAWAMVTIILYFFAIWFTQAVLNLQPDNMPLHSQKNAEEMFGTLPRSILSLIQAMLDGRSWGVFADALNFYGAYVAPVFYLYVIFIRLAILNIITGVFVDQAVAAAQADRELVVMNELVASERYRGELQELFTMIDADGSRTVSLEELEYFFSDDRMVAYFSALGMRAEDMTLLFTLLDVDGSGQVDFEEFVEGCLRLKGTALRVDVAFILRSIKQLQYVVNRSLAGEHDPAAVRQESSGHVKACN